MEEKWMDIVGFEGLYQVSNLGRVKSLERKVIRRNGRVQSFKEIIKKPSVNSDGYLMIILSNKTNGHILHTSIHRLVAQAFIPNPDNKPTVNHKDHNRQNNNVNNLEWATMAEQADEITRLNHTIAQTNGKKSKAVLCVETGVVYPSTAEISRLTKMDYSNIAKVCRGIWKTAYGYHWKYV